MRTQKSGWIMAAVAGIGLGLGAVNGIPGSPLATKHGVLVEHYEKLHHGRSPMPVNGEQESPHGLHGPFSWQSSRLGDGPVSLGLGGAAGAPSSHAQNSDTPQ